MTASLGGPPPRPDLRPALVAVRDEVAKAVVGQDAVVTGMLIALLCHGHVLVEGVPGTAKTLLVRALARALAVKSTRVQFTPDLMRQGCLHSRGADLGIIDPNANHRGH